MSKGEIINQNGKLGSTYPERPDALYDLIDDFYLYQYGLSKSAGAATYGDNGYFNAVMGKEITAAMFATDTIFASLGAKPYNHEGVRIATKLATYGLDGEGRFVGLGAGTVQDGDIPESVSMPVDEFRQPYKDLAFSFDIGLGLMALMHKDDDVIGYQDYVDKMTLNYSDQIDKSLVRPITVQQPTVGGTETSVNSIQRCIASGTEINAETWTSDGDITPAMVSPYGGANGDYYAFRGQDYATSQAHTVNNLDGNVIDLQGGTLTIADFKKLWRTCSVNWQNAGSPNNKVWYMSNVVQDKLAALMLANNVYLESVYVQKDFNGVKTLPGRDAGMLLRSFQNTPIIQNGNLNFDYTTARVSAVKSGDVLLLDLDHIWISMLTPMEVYNINNPAVTRKLQERNVINMRCELRTDSYIQHGKIVNVGDESA